MVFGFSSPPACCHGCFLKIQNHLSISHSGLGCSFSISVNEGGIKQVSNYCPDPGEPENGKRIGSDFRWVSPQQPACYEPDLCWWELELSELVFPDIKTWTVDRVGIKMHRQTRWRVVLHCLYLLRLVKYLIPHLQSYVPSSIPVFCLIVLIKRRVQTGLDPTIPRWFSDHHVHGLGKLVCRKFELFCFLRRISSGFTTRLWLCHDICCSDITAVTMETVNVAESSLSISASICNAISGLRIASSPFNLHFNSLNHYFVLIWFDAFSQHTNVDPVWLRFKWLKLLK